MRALAHRGHAEHMSRRINYREHTGPEHQRWGRKYPRFPGVPECVRLIKEHKARGTWADIIAFELADHAGECYEELVSTFRAESHEDVRLYIMMALELAVQPDMTPFLREVLQCGDPRLVPYAERALRAIDTRKARAALWHARHQEEHRDVEPPGSESHD
jgi:hypothetical protein